MPETKTYYVILRKGRQFLCSGPLDDTVEGMADFRRQLSRLGISVELMTAERAGKARGGVLDYDNPASAHGSAEPVYRVGILPRDTETAEGDPLLLADDPLEREVPVSAIERQNRQIIGAYNYNDLHG